MRSCSLVGVPGLMTTYGMRVLESSPKRTLDVFGDESLVGKGISPTGRELRLSPSKSRREFSTGKMHDSLDASVAELEYSRKDGLLEVSSFPTLPLSRVPAFIEHAGKALSFQMYFRESVVESPLETYRTRHLVLRYFPEDGTFDVTEPDVLKNGGIPTGKFLKRTSDAAVSFELLLVGGSISLLGRTLIIYNCDAFTREFYEKRGITQADEIHVPEDPSATVIRLSLPHGDAKEWFGKTDNPPKRYMEKTLGRGASHIESTLKYLEYDRVKLVFQAIWDDRETLFGDVSLFNLAFYMSTGEVEIFREKGDKPDQVANLFLKRIKLPRSLIFHDDRVRGCEDYDGRDDYYEAKDFVVGKHIVVYGRKMLLYDCTDATHEWCLSNVGIDQKSGRVIIEETKEEVKERIPPPPTGFGSDEDSLQSWKLLIPRPPKDRPRKLDLAPSKTLKFSARLVSDDPIAASRRFRISVYINDDSITITEFPGRNSGVMGGLWQTRAKLDNVDTGKLFTKAEFFVGAEITIKSHRFHIDGADEFSEKHLTGSGSTKSVDFIMSTLKAKITEGSKSLRKMFRKFDTDKTMTITFDEFRKMLSHYGMEATTEEALSIYRTFDTDGSGIMDYHEFMKAFAEKDNVGGVKGASRGFDLTVKEMSAEESKEYERMMREVTGKEKAAKYTEELLARLARQMKNAKSANLIHEQFRAFDANKDHTISRDEFRMALCSDGLFHLNPEDVELLIDRFFKADEENINYEAFMKMIYFYADKVVRSS